MDMILNGDYDDIGAEKLRGLMKILPEHDEVRTWQTQCFGSGFGSMRIRINLSS